MHNFVKILCCAVLVGAVSACGGGVRLEFKNISYETGTIVASGGIPRITGLSDKAFEDAVNEEYEDIIGGFLEEVEESAKEAGGKSTFSVETCEHYNRKEFFSAVTDVSAKIGGSISKSQRIARNIDPRSCREAALSDLFEGDGYIDMINSRLSEAVSENPAEYSGLWAKPQLMENQGYYISEGRLVLFYPPYELSYYERGYVEIPLELEAMSGYLKPEYRELAGKTAGSFFAKLPFFWKNNTAFCAPFVYLYRKNGKIFSRNSSKTPKNQNIYLKNLTLSEKNSKMNDVWF